MPLASTMKFIFVITLIILIRVNGDVRLRKTGRNRSPCNMSRKEASLCAKRTTLYGDRTLKVPTNIDETTPFCNLLLAAADCLKSYSNCVDDPISKSVLKSYVKRYKKQLSLNYCTEAAKKYIFENLCPDPTRREASARCVDKFRSTLVQIRDQIDVQNKLPATCCTFNVLRECISMTTREQCTHKNAEEIVTIRDSFVVRSSDTFASSFCQPMFDTDEKCMRRIPLIAEQLRSVYSNETVGSDHESGIMIFLDILAQLSAKEY